MRLNEKYECSYLPGATLIVSEVYNNGKMGLVQVEPKTNGHASIMCKHDLHSDPELMLAHKHPRDALVLKIKQEEFEW